MSRIPHEVVAEVEERAGWACEACGATVSGKPDLHHRKARGIGGTSEEDLDVATNIIRIHPRCHAWIHAHPRVGREHGWIVRRGDDPAQVEVKVNPSLYRWAA